MTILLFPTPTHDTSNSIDETQHPLEPERARALELHLERMGAAHDISLAVISDTRGHPIAYIGVPWQATTLAAALPALRRLTQAHERDAYLDVLAERLPALHDAHLEHASLFVRGRRLDLCALVPRSPTHDPLDDPLDESPNDDPLAAHVEPIRQIVRHPR